MLIDTITTSEKVAREKSHVIVAISDQAQLASLTLIASLLIHRPRVLSHGNGELHMASRLPGGVGGGDKVAR